MNEIWKDIVGYEGLYQISNLGRVKSLKFGKEKIMNSLKNSNGYLSICLSKGGIQKRYFIHRLVALVFIPNPDNKPCVDHINGIRTDNRVNNLRWCTNKENQNFPLARKNNSIAHINHPKKSKAVLQIDKVTGKIIKEYLSTMEAARQLGIDQSSISKCCNGKLKTTGNYTWKYA